MAAKRLGRRPLVWLAITICFTAIPAMIVLYRDAMRRHRQRLTEARAGNASAGSMFRCPHCQALIDPSELSGMPIQTCPRCHLHIEKANLA
jgi:UDP-N-acetylenolpyruvoylglucosamine reductase